MTHEDVLKVLTLILLGCIDILAIIGLAALSVTLMRHFRNGAK